MIELLSFLIVFVLILFNHKRANNLFCTIEAEGAEDEGEPAEKDGGGEAEDEGESQQKEKDEGEKITHAELKKLMQENPDEAVKYYEKLTKENGRKRNVIKLLKSEFGIDLKKGATPTKQKNNKTKIEVDDIQDPKLKSFVSNILSENQNLNQELGKRDENDKKLFYKRVEKLDLPEGIIDKLSKLNPSERLGWLDDLEDIYQKPNNDPGGQKIETENEGGLPGNDNLKAQEVQTIEALKKDPLNKKLQNKLMLIKFDLGKLKGFDSLT